MREVVRPGEILGSVDEEDIRTFAHALRPLGLFEERRFRARQGQTDYLPTLPLVTMIEATKLVAYGAALYQAAHGLLSLVTK